MRLFQALALGFVLAGGSAGAAGAQTGAVELLSPTAWKAQFLRLFGAGDCKRQAVLQINAVTLARAGELIEVYVDGVAPTPLWTDAALVTRGGRQGRTLELEFIACPPGKFVVQILAPMSARQIVDFAPRDLDAIVVYARTNSMRARVAEFLR